MLQASSETRTGYHVNKTKIILFPVTVKLENPLSVETFQIPIIVLLINKNIINLYICIWAFTI